MMAARAVHTSATAKEKIWGVMSVSRLRAGLRRIFMFVAIAIGALMFASYATASMRDARRSWPVVHRILHRSAGNARLGRALRLARPSSRAHASIVGGSQITISQAPWQVFVVSSIPLAEEGELLLLCGGSIIDATHIVTAGHCLFDPQTGLQVPGEHVTVLAGASDFAQLEPSQQEVKVASVRVHPYFEYGLQAGAPDDVAVLVLGEPLSFNAFTQPIGLDVPGTALLEGASVNLTGFGRETLTGHSEGPLHSIGMTVGFSRSCGGPADALFVCA
jgi:Trypsin